jgi:hypothetical protein
MNHIRIERRAKRVAALGAWAFSAVIAGHTWAATVPPAPPPDEGELLGLGFKVLVAQTDVQRDWVKTLTPGKMNAKQRTGKKFFIYPDPAKNRIFVGGPQEYEGYLQLHPDNTKPGAQESSSRAYRAKQDDVMRKSTARDLSNPFLGASWNDFIW